MSEKLIKVLLSFPVLLIVLYFIPFLGVILLIAKFALQKGWSNNNYIKSMVILLVVGLLLFIPNLVNSAITNFKLKVTIPYLNEIIDSDLYMKLISYAKRLVIIAIIFVVLGYIVKKIIIKTTSAVSSAFQKHIEVQTQIARENDLKVREKQARAKNFHTVKCPHCGAINHISSQTAQCQYCRNYIEYKEK